MKTSQFRHQIFIFGILLLAISVPTSKFGMSLAQMILAANWLIDKDLYLKTKQFLRNKIALSFSLIFFVHVLWLINTTNFNYALDDLRTKAPLFILAVIFSTTPRLSKKEFWTLLLFHATAVLITSFISANIYFTLHPADFRIISPHISHIRLALNVCIAIFSLSFFVFQNPFKTQKLLLFFQRFGFIIVIFWYIYFLSMLQSVTGILILIILSLLIGFNYLRKSNLSKTLKGLFVVLLISIPIILSVWATNLFNHYMSKPAVNISQLDITTKKGGVYIHDTTNYCVENGRWMGLYLCEPELLYAWDLRSRIKYNTPDLQGNTINYTLIRYLTSKDLRKDYDGVQALTDWDVNNIEKGIANINYAQGIGIKARLFKLFWEYNNYMHLGDVFGHSLFQRLELWETSRSIINKNWFFGVGTGDVPDAFKKQLTEDNSSLKTTRMRSHNQYLSLFVGFGLFGLVLCIFSFIYPFVKSKQIFDYFCLVFLIVIYISMLSEDTIESQDGVTFYAFFATIYLFQKPIKRTTLIKGDHD